jgi:acetyl-CoA carboxylase carboxyl transferase subunit alpha
VIKEPMGGAQRDRDTTIAEVGKAIRSMLAQLKDRKGADLIASRRRKFLDMGAKGLAA